MAVILLRDELSNWLLYRADGYIDPQGDVWLHEALEQLAVVQEPENFELAMWVQRTEYGYESGQGVVFT